MVVLNLFIQEMEIHPFQIKLTWLKNHPQPYDLSKNESHICFIVDDYEAYHKLHQQMDCICFENQAIGLYFISNPNDYWSKIYQKNKKTDFSAFLFLTPIF